MEDTTSMCCIYGPVSCNFIIEPKDGIWTRRNILETLRGCINDSTLQDVKPSRTAVIGLSWPATEESLAYCRSNGFVEPRHVISRQIRTNIMLDYHDNFWEDIADWPNQSKLDDPIRLCNGGNEIVFEAKYGPSILMMKSLVSILKEHGHEIIGDTVDVRYHV